MSAGRLAAGTPFGGFQGLLLRQATLMLAKALQTPEQPMVSFAPHLQHGHLISIHSSPNTASLPCSPSCWGSSPAWDLTQFPSQDPFPNISRGSEAASGPQAHGRRVGRPRRTQVQRLWAGSSTSGSRTGPASLPSSLQGQQQARRAGQGRELFNSPLEIKKEAERVWFSLIFFFKSFLASLPRLLPIFLRGGGRARSRERLAGFCFQFAQTNFLCVFFLFLEIHCRQALPAEIVIFKGKISCKHIWSLSVCPGSAKP